MALRVTYARASSYAHLLTSKQDFPPPHVYPKFHATCPTETQTIRSDHSEHCWAPGAASAMCLGVDLIPRAPHRSHILDHSFLSRSLRKRDWNIWEPRKKSLALPQRLFFIASFFFHTQPKHLAPTRAMSDAQESLQEMFPLAVASFRPSPSPDGSTLQPFRMTLSFCSLTR